MQSIALGPDLPPEQIVEAQALRIQLRQEPRRYYRHGWQSWSLAAWVDAKQAILNQKPSLLHPMQLDPMYAARRDQHGSWVGAVDLGADRILLLGALGLEAHVALEGEELHGWSESGSVSWFIANGDEQEVFRRYAEELIKRFGTRAAEAAPRVWCSWYSLYTAIDELGLARTFEALGDLPFDVVQVDDGWQLDIGDWEPNSKFPTGMQALAESIRSTGRRAGLWLAPFIVKASAKLAREHSDWLLHDRTGKLVSAGFNWGARLYALDTTHPGAAGWLKSLMQQVREWGYDYLKLDFLYGGALPGERHNDMPRETAFRAALKTLRVAAGPDAFLVACGAPIVPSLGLCDALRAGPDVSDEWENARDAMLLHNPSIPGMRNAIRTTLHRLWLRPLVHVDPDVAYFRSRDCRLTPEQKRLQQSLALICAFKTTSDLPQTLNTAEREALRQFLEAAPHITQTEAREFSIDGQHVDFRAALDIAAEPHGLDTVMAPAIGWLANQERALRVENWLRERAWRKKKRDRQ